MTRKDPEEESAMAGLPAGSNVGVFNSGSGQVRVGGSAIGQQVNYARADGSPRGEPTGEDRADVAILTVLPEEMRAVVGVIRELRDYESVAAENGALVHKATVDANGGTLDVVAMQAVRTPQGAAAAYQWICRQYRPVVLVFVGIAGGIRDDVSIGDVVISDEIILYDARRETADGPRRRGQTQAIGPALRHRINDYFVQFGNGIDVPDGARARVFAGPIGSGGAVVTDERSEIRRYLLEFNEKTLAVETESAELAQAFYLDEGDAAAPRAWLAIRGISDHADRAKGHRDHQLAADNAAAVMRQLLPLLRLDRPGA